MSNVYKVGSLFAGVGGVCLGFQNAKVHGSRYELVWANEIDVYACETYRNNFEHKLIQGDINKVLNPEKLEEELLYMIEKPKIKEMKQEIDYYKKKHEEILEYKIDVLLGGFPCQAFSIAGERKGFEDDRGNLFLSIINLINQLQKKHGTDGEYGINGKPRILFLENVKNLKGHNMGRTYEIIKAELKKIGYTIKEHVINTMDYSDLPQNRERIYIIGFLHKQDAEKFDLFDNIEKFKKVKTPEDRIEDIKKIIDYNITKNTHEKYYYTKIKYPNYFISEEEYNLHPVDKRKAERVNLDEQIDEMYQFYQIRRGMYVRKNMSGVCPTLTANMGTGGHNVPLIKVKDGIRKLTPKETFKLQGFPIDNGYKLPVEYNGRIYSDSHLYKQSGNAVSVPVIEFLANEVLKILEYTSFRDSIDIKNKTIYNKIVDNSETHKEVSNLEKLMLPDRYEGLEYNRPKYDISKIILPVKEGLDKISEMYEEIESSNRGAFLILKGKSGCGKTTFLKTLDIFIEDIEINTILNNIDLVEAINIMKGTKKRLRVIIVEGRESLLDSSLREINNSIHSINEFLRSKNGKNTLVVWPCNDKEIIEILVDKAENIGGTSLLDLDETYFEFQGPSKEHYLTIAKQTIELLNNGMTLLDFGLTDKQARLLIDEVDTIGKYLKIINKVIRKNKNVVEKLVKREPCKMWILVLAGNEPHKDVAALTKGEFLATDIERMLSSTNANIVEELKRYPDKIGILSSYFDCRIIYMPIVTSLSIIRDFAEDTLREILKENNLSDNKDGSGIKRLLNSELAEMINSDYKSQAKKGKTGPNSISAFEKLTKIASKNDEILNKTFGKALVEAGLIKKFKIEDDFGSGLIRRTDLTCKTELGEIRLEFMWRRSTSQAEIANYTLTKLYNYGRAIGLLE